MKAVTWPVTTAIRDVGADKNAGKDLSLIGAWYHGRRDAALDASVAANRVWTHRPPQLWRRQTWRMRPRWAECHHCGKLRKAAAREQSFVR